MGDIRKISHKNATTWRGKTVNLFLDFINIDYHLTSTRRDLREVVYVLPSGAVLLFDEEAIVVVRVGDEVAGGMVVSGREYGQRRWTVVELTPVVELVTSRLLEAGLAYNMAAL